jgi:hypothetical protein
MKNRIKGLKLLIILISFIIAIAVIPNISAEEVIISIGNFAADPGETCTAPVELKSIKDYGTGAITIAYNPSIVHVTDIKGSEDSTIVAWKADNEIGEAKIAAWNINGVSGDIDFAIITFSAANKSGSTPLTIKVEQLITQDEEGVQNSIVAKVINGNFKTGASSIPGFELLHLLIILGVISIYYSNFVNNK